ncbi:aldolase [Hyaloscypha variabilis]
MTRSIPTDVAKPGVVPVVSATMGEAAHLDFQERIQLIQALRSALNENGLHGTPIVAGVGATSTRETISLAKDAAAAGAEFVLVIAPSYYASTLKANPTAIKRFFIDVASKSPVPVVIYNFPMVAGGIDLSSDDVVDIARAAPNICGIMLSCGNIGKVSRITSLLDGSFKILAGFIDFLLPAVSIGSAGAISPLPNIAPEFAMELWRATQSLDSATDWSKARRLREIASLAEAELLKGGVAGLKYLLHHRFGYSATPRLPLQPLSEDAVPICLITHS